MEDERPLTTPHFFLFFPTLIGPRATAVPHQREGAVRPSRVLGVQGGAQERRPRWGPDGSSFAGRIYPSCFLGSSSCRQELPPLTQSVFYCPLKRNAPLLLDAELFIYFPPLSLRRIGGPRACCDMISGVSEILPVFVSQL